MIYKKGDRVLVNIDPMYGEWLEAEVVGEVTAVNVRFRSGARDSGKWSDPEVFQADQIIGPIKKEAGK